MDTPRYGQIMADMLNAERYDKATASLDRQYRACEKRSTVPQRDPANVTYIGIPALPDQASIERGLLYRSTYTLYHTPRIPTLKRVELPTGALASYLMHENRHGVDYYWWDYLVRC